MKTPIASPESPVIASAGPAAGAELLAFELAFTAAHRAHAEGTAAAREVASLRLLFPAVLQPIADGDLLAGRIRYRLVGFSPEPRGFGYYCCAEEIRALLDSSPVTESRRAAIEEMLAYWDSRTSSARTRAAYPAAVAAALPSDGWTTDSGVGFPLYRLAGTVLDYAKLLRLGLPGLGAEIAARRARLPQGDTSGMEFLDTLSAGLEVVAESCRHYAAQARALAGDCGEPAREAELRRVADSCEAIAVRAPSTLHEAAQLTWLYVLHSGTWNYGRMDVYLGPFLAADLAAGRAT
ncbi:MAG TPA: pyruvate formate lyase family protein, partial [Opitutaceae bacterium]